MELKKKEEAAGPLSILWIDDEPAQLISTSDFLISRCHVAIDFASTVAVAIGRVRDCNYDLIILDVILPAGELTDDQVEIQERLSLYGDRAGLGFLELISDRTLDALPSKHEPSKIPVIVSSYVEDSLLQNYELLRKENVLVCPKSNFVFEPQILLNLIGTCLPLLSKEEGASSRRTRFRDDDPAGLPLPARQDRLPSIVSRLLHDHSNALLTITSAIKRATGAIGPSPFDSSPRLSVEELNDFLGEPAHRLLAEVESLYKNLSSRPDPSQVPVGLMKGILDTIDRVRMLLSGGVILQVEKFSEVVAQIRSHLPGFRGIAPRQPIKKIRAAANDLDRCLTLYHLHQALLRIQEMEIHAELVRSYYAPGGELLGKPSKFDLAEIVLDVKAHLAGYLRLRHVELRLYKKDALGRKRKGLEEQDFKGDRQAITRALRNVIHNGIKYSYYLGGDKPPWIDVITSQEGTEYLIEVESWGVPIPEKEIESGDIFLEGFRGTEANDRGRVGSGIGLSDALRTMELHNGRIEVKSAPPPNRNAGSTAFLTTVTLAFPLNHKK